MRNIAKWILIAVFWGLGYPAYSATLTYQFNGVFSGDTPGGTSPWLTATFEDLTGLDYGTGVTLTMELSSDFPNGQFVRGVYFNLDPTLDPVSSAFTNTGGVAADSQAQKIRKLAYASNRSYMTYKTYIEGSSPEVAANAMLCLIHQTNFLLDQQLRQLEKKFLEEGGFTEKLYRTRLKARSRS